MIEINEEMTQQDFLTGDTLLTSAAAYEKLLRTSDSNRFDFIEEFYEKMRKVLHSKTWDRAEDWVLTDSVLISPSEFRVGIWLHKLHHLHIAALYSALSELED